MKLAKEVPGFEVNVPEGAFYLFPKCSSFFGKSAGDRKIENSDDLAMYLLEVAHVACVGGTSLWKHCQSWYNLLMTEVHLRCMGCNSAI